MEDEKSTAAKRSGGPDESLLIQKVAAYSFLLNLGLVIVKAALAFMSGSLALTASAIDSGTDSVASLAMFGGLRLSTRQSRSFPYGLYKIENVISVVVAIFIFFAGYEVTRHALSPGEAAPDISLAVVAVLAATVLVTFLFGRYAYLIGKRTESPTLMAEGRHRQTDVLSSAVVLVSVVMGYLRVEVEFHGIGIDQAAAGLVVIFIAHAGWRLLSDGMRVLLDASVDFDTLAATRKIIESHPLVDNVEGLSGRNAGRFKFIEAQVFIRTDDLVKAHQASDEIEETIKAEVPHVGRVIIHCQPRARECMRVAVPLADPAGEISDHFGESPYFAIIDLRIKDKSVQRQETIQNPHAGVKTGKGIKTAEWLLGRKVDKVLTRHEMGHRGPAYVFSSAGVDVELIHYDNLDRALIQVREEL